MSGLQGSGKTTFTAKLANKLKNEKANARYWRPATFIVPQP